MGKAFCALYISSGEYPPAVVCSGSNHNLVTWLAGMAEVEGCAASWRQLPQATPYRVFLESTRRLLGAVLLAHKSLASLVCSP